MAENLQYSLQNILVLGEDVNRNGFGAIPRAAFLVYKSNETLLVTSSGTDHLKPTPGLFLSLDYSRYANNDKFVPALHPDGQLQPSELRHQRVEVLYLHPEKVTQRDH